VYAKVFDLQEFPQVVSPPSRRKNFFNENVTGVAERQIWHYYFLCNALYIELKISVRSNTIVDAALQLVNAHGVHTACSKMPLASLHGLK